jgi:UDP-N-acetylglucosamine 2-epimerase (non-hydrolysing)
VGWETHSSPGDRVESGRRKVSFHIAKPTAATIRVFAVMGTRPEVIKLARVVHALREDPGFEVTVCAVHQQTSILEAALTEWGLSPDVRIDLDRPGSQIGSTLSAVISGMSDYLAQRRPDLIIVQGDTTTALGSALAGFYAKVPVAHVEAGLRSRDASHPFPEEVHRILIDDLAAIHYAPTELARRNLYDDGHRDGTVSVVGNTVVDALLHMRDRVRQAAVAEANQRRLLLVTAHRRESFGEGIRSICEAVRNVVRSRYDVEAMFVLHPNPAASETARAVLGGEPRIHLIAPQGYEEFVGLMDRAYLMITDSGGIQEEAPYLGTPILVTRETTERQEAVELGLARVVGTSAEVIEAAVLELLDDEDRYRAMIAEALPFGDGTTAHRIRADITRRMRILQLA